MKVDFMQIPFLSPSRHGKAVTTSRFFLQEIPELIEELKAYICWSLV